MIDDNLPERTYSFHGMIDTPEYGAWAQMKSQCYNKYEQAYRYFGKRGVRVCAEWHQFLNFFRDMGKRPSKKHRLTLINRDGHYEPGNVEWRLRGEK